MADAQLLNENPRGSVRLEGNALITDSKIEDAAEVRVGAPQGTASSGGGKYSFDVLLPNGSRREIALLAAGEGSQGAEWKLILLKKGGETADGDQVTVMEATAAGIEFKVPVKMPGLPAPLSAKELYSADRKYVAVEQGDRNFVVYQIDANGIWTARWSRPDWSAP